MKTKTVFRLSIFLICLSISLTIGGFWWWALVGIRQEVGQAAGVTAVISVILGIILLALFNDMKAQEESPE